MAPSPSLEPNRPATPTSTPAKNVKKARRIGAYDSAIYQTVRTAGTSGSIEMRQSSETCGRSLANSQTPVMVNSFVSISSSVICGDWSIIVVNVPTFLSPIPVWYRCTPPSKGHFGIASAKAINPSVPIEFYPKSNDSSRVVARREYRPVGSLKSAAGGP